MVLYTQKSDDVSYTHKFGNCARRNNRQIKHELLMCVTSSQFSLVFRMSTLKYIKSRFFGETLEDTHAYGVAQKIQLTTNIILLNRKFYSLFLFESLHRIVSNFTMFVLQD